MAQKKKDKISKHTSLAINVTSYLASVDVSLNYEASDPRHYREKAKVFKFSSRVEIEGTCKYPEDRIDEMYRITLHGDECRENDFSLRLEDFHVRDEHGDKIWRKTRDKIVPIYNPPKGMGLLERERGTKIWIGWLWVTPQTINDMLTMLPHIHPLFLDIHERQEGRQHWIVGISLKTSDPSLE